MTVIPEPIASAEQAWRELGRVRSLIADRVDPLAGLLLAEVQDWIAACHPGVDTGDHHIAESFPATHGWPYLPAPAPHTRHRDPIYVEERAEQSWRHVA